MKGLFYIVATSCQYCLHDSPIYSRKGLFESVFSLLSRAQRTRRLSRSGLCFCGCTGIRFRWSGDDTGFLQFIIKVQRSRGRRRFRIRAVSSGQRFGRRALRGLIRRSDDSKKRDNARSCLRPPYLLLFSKRGTGYCDSKYMFSGSSRISET
jgi:hypothetical protein